VSTARLAADTLFRFMEKCAHVVTSRREKEDFEKQPYALPLFLRAEARKTRHANRRSVSSELSDTSFAPRPQRCITEPKRESSRIKGVAAIISRGGATPWPQSVERKKRYGPRRIDSVLYTAIVALSPLSYGPKINAARVVMERSVL